MFVSQFVLTIHRAWLGLRYGVEESIKSADVILVLDCDVPWINTQCKPNADAQIYHIDVDPLKQQMPVFYLNALARYKADSYLAITQLTAYIHSTEELKTKVASSEFEERWTKLQDSYKKKLQAISDLAKPADDGTYATSYLISRVRHFCPQDTIWAIEAVTQTPFVADQLQAKYPGSWLNCGGGGLGWSGGGRSSNKMNLPNVD
jgi:thiamine pyrophosphate-dependent acetolactate synthase large subunit-like protein